MGDLGHELWFGAFLTPDAANHEQLIRLAVHADEIGLDLLGVQDHPYQPSFLDTWTLLSTLAARTSRVRLVPDVLNLPLRPPAMLARSAASLDILSGGRVELGLGSGAFWDGVVAMGGERRTPAEAVSALDEAIDVIRALWTPGTAGRVDGEHYRLRGARPGPVPPHPIGIWVGAYKPRMLRLIGRKADGWLPSSPYASPDELRAMTAILDAAAADAGRDPAAVRRIYNINGRFSRRPQGGFLDGPARLWAEQLTELALELGVSGFVVAPGPDAERDLTVVAEEVAPLVRAAVAAERGQADADAGSPVREQVVVASADPLDAESRPRLPKRDLAELTPAQQSSGQRLVLVHNHLRKELQQLADAIGEVAAGRRSAGSVRSLINQLTMRQNYWTLGAFCAGYCRLVTTHHTIEDEHMFPALVAKQDSLAPVVLRLEQEHEVIAATLTELDALLVAMIEDPAGLDGVRDQVELLSVQLLSHLDYEEQELVEPLARLGLDI